MKRLHNPSDELLAHAVGDYLLQSDWMAKRKTEEHLPAAIHAALYTLPFVALTRNPLRLAVIGGTHFLIDRYQLAHEVVKAKNNLAPDSHFDHATGTGYHFETPGYLTVILGIIADNTIHALINRLALRGE